MNRAPRRPPTAVRCRTLARNSGGARFTCPYRAPSIRGAAECSVRRSEVGASVQLRVGWCSNTDIRRGSPLLQTGQFGTSSIRIGLRAVVSPVNGRAGHREGGPLKLGYAARGTVFSILLGLCVLLLLQPPFAAAASRTVRVGVFPAAPLVQNTEGEPEGLFIDLIQYYATSLDWRVEYVEKPWSELLVDLETGEIDLLPAVAVTDERLKIYDYSEHPPFIDSGVLFTGPHFHLDTVFDLQGARVAGVEGSIFTSAFESYAASFGVEVDMVLEEDNSSVMQAITDGTADAGISIYSLGVELERNYPVSLTAVSFFPSALSFAVPKGKNGDLISGIDRLMAPMVTNPNSLYSRSFAKWILTPPRASVPAWIWWGVGALCLFGLVFAFWSVLLRRQVSAKTKHLVAEISERERAQEQLRQSQKMEAVGRLAGGIAHDFNNLLTVITGNAALLEGELASAGHSPPELSSIREAAARAGGLTRQLLAFSRRQALRTRVFDLNGVTEEMADLLRRIIGEDVDLLFRRAEDLWPVEADPSQVEQVIMNLAVNARDAMPEGGALTIETSNTSLDQSYADSHAGVVPGEYVMVAVTDTGHGMTKEIAAQVFEPFFTTKEHGKGTGLGLSTVYGIVKQSRGSVWVYSEPGQGTTFKVYLPRAEGSIDWTPTAQPRAAVATGGSKTILVVEDEPAVRTFTVRVLKEAGYGVLQAGAPAEALALFDECGQQVHLLLTDVVLPGMSGRTLAQTICARQGGSPRVLYMSGYTQNAIVHDGRLDAGVALLEKPFTPEALLLKVLDVLDGPAEE
ncbi:MAG: ATP-binding protein [Thermoleophilia bacterium]